MRHTLSGERKLRAAVKRQQVFNDAYATELVRVCEDVREEAGITFLG